MNEYRAYIDVRKDSRGVYRACVVRWAGKLVDFRPDSVQEFMEGGEDVDPREFEEGRTLGDRQRYTSNPRGW